MSIQLKKTLVLTFTTQSGKELNLTINEPKENLEGTAVKAAMNSIAAAKALGKTDLVTSIKEARYITQTADNIEMA